MPFLLEKVFPREHSLSSYFTFACVFCSVLFKGWNKHIYLNISFLRIERTWKCSSKEKEKEKSGSGKQLFCQSQVLLHVCEVPQPQDSLKAVARGFESSCLGVKKQADNKGGQRKPEEDGHTHCSWTLKS